MASAVGWVIFLPCRLGALYGLGKYGSLRDRRAQRAPGSAPRDDPAFPVGWVAFGGAGCVDSLPRKRRRSTRRLSGVKLGLRGEYLAIRSIVSPKALIARPESLREAGMVPGAGSDSWTFRN